MDETSATVDRFTGQKGRSWRSIALVVLLAFLGGLLAMAWIAKNVSLPSWLGGNAATEGAYANSMMEGSAMAQPASLPAASQPAPQPATAQIGSIEQRLAEASAAAEDAAGNATNAEDLLIAFAVRRTIDRGDQLGYLEPQLRRRFAGQPNAVNAVITGARRPVTLATLRLGLEDVNPALVSSDKGWFAALAAEFTSFFTVRDKGAPSHAPSARLERARQLLLGGQVEAAIAEVAAMPSTDESARWLANAKHYVDVHRALDVIEAQVLQPVSTQPPPAR